jgi:hypothetical protein
MQRHNEIDRGVPGKLRGNEAVGLEHELHGRLPGLEMVPAAALACPRVK